MNFGSSQQWDSNLAKQLGKEVAAAEARQETWNLSLTSVQGFSPPPLHPEMYSKVKQRVCGKEQLGQNNWRRGASLEKHS